MRFEDPLLLALLVVIPLYVWLLSRWESLPRPRYLLPELAARGAQSSGRLFRTRRWLSLLRVGAAVLLVVAIARPQATTVEAVRPAEGIDIVLVIDASTSMAQARIADGVTRIAAAREVAREFVRGREEDRIGLVIFQRRSLVLSPLTLDLEAIDALIESSVRTGLIPDGTALGVAIAEAVDLLRDSGAASRIVVALTDGQNNVPDVTVNQATAIARALGVRVYTVGLPDSARNRTNLVGLDELTLIYVADETGGRYFRATDERELSSAYDEIAALERERVGEVTFETIRELGGWALLAALALLLIDAAARTGPWRRLP